MDCQILCYMIRTDIKWNKTPHTRHGSPVARLQQLDDKTPDSEESSHLQLCHERLEGVEEEASVMMRYRLFVQGVLQLVKERVELLGLNDRPWYNIDPPTVEARYEVRLLLPLNNLLKLETESVI
jgi:hypothetical protein